jgi:hypothetical protein
MPIALRMEVLRPRKVKVIAFVCIALATVLGSAQLALALWADNEFTQPEGIVATQVRHFAQTGALYFDLGQYPYTVCAYMPVFYTLAAGLVKLGIPVLLADRLLSILGLLGLIWLTGRITAVYGLEPVEQRMTMALAGLTQLLLNWGTVGQVDTLAIACSLAAFYHYARFERHQAASLPWAAGFALAGMLTKQTAIAAPAVIFLLLLLKGHRREAMRFAGIVAGLGGALVLGLNAALEGRFLANTLFANINPFAISKLGQALQYFLAVLSPLLVLVLASLPAARRDGYMAPYLYLAMALSVFLLTAAKVGADANYLIESAVTLVIAAMVGLSRLRFFELFARGSQSWVTLLVLPLGLFVVQNARIGVLGWKERLDRERSFSEQVTGVKPYLAVPGRVLSADSNALLRAERSFEVEPLIYRLLVEAGRIDGRRLERDLDQGVFETIILYDDVRTRINPDPEIPRLTEQQREAIRRRYELVRHVAGPYLGGLYVYQPQGAKSW